VDELVRVAAHRAASVVVLSTPHAGKPAGRDSEAIKTMMLLTGSVDMEGHRPTLIAEIEDPHNLQMASMAGRGQFQIVASGTVISKVIVQCIRNPGLSAVYRELFEPMGNSIYVEEIAAERGKTMRSIATRMPTAVPIGVTWSETTDGAQRVAAALNLEPEYELDDDDSLIVIAGQPGERTVAPDNRTEGVARTIGSGRSANTPRRVLLIGWNGELYDILAELDAHALDDTEITLLSVVSEDDAAERVAEFLDAPLKNVTVEFRVGNPVNQSAYHNLDLQDFDCIVVLADDAADAAEVDAYTLRIVLRLSDVSGEAPAVHTVVELTDGMNRPLFDSLDVTDIVASADIVSAELAQTARQPVLGPVYRELLRAGGVELSVRPVGDYLPGASECTFADLVLAAQGNLETAVGVMVGSEVLLNPPRDVRRKIDDSLQLVVLAQQLYR
jgi:Trk K+ transport system NAD-binding subunit